MNTANDIRNAAKLVLKQGFKFEHGLCCELAARVNESNTYLFMERLIGSRAFNLGLGPDGVMNETRKKCLLFIIDMTDEQFYYVLNKESENECDYFKPYEAWQKVFNELN